MLYFVQLQKVAHTAAAEGKNMLCNKLCLRIISLSWDVHHKPQSNPSSMRTVPIRKQSEHRLMLHPEITEAAIWKLCQNATTAKSLPILKHTKHENTFWLF